jgi:hypothetical protein
VRAGRGHAVRPIGALYAPVGASIDKGQRVHTDRIFPVTTRAMAATLALLIAALCACAPTTSPAAVAPAAVRAPQPKPSTFAIDEALAIATARDQAARADRAHTLLVQRQLVEQRRATRDAAKVVNPNERCIAGQKVRHVGNGWMQAGSC